MKETIVEKKDDDYDDDDVHVTMKGLILKQNLIRMKIHFFLLHHSRNMILYWARHCHNDQQPQAEPLPHPYIHASQQQQQQQQQCGRRATYSSA